MKKYFIIGGTAALFFVLALMAFGIFSQARENVYKSTILQELPSDLAKFYHQSHRLPLNWEEFVSWTKKNPTPRNWSIDELNSQFVLKWGTEITSHDQQDEELLIPLTSEFQLFKPTLNARLRDLCLNPTPTYAP